MIAPGSHEILYFRIKNKTKQNPTRAASCPGSAPHHKREKMLGLTAGLGRKALLNQGLQGTQRRDPQVGAAGSAGHRKWRLERGGGVTVSTGRRGTSCTPRSLADQRGEPLRVSPSLFYFRGLGGMIPFLPQVPGQRACQQPGPHPFWRQQLGARATGSTARAKGCAAHARPGRQRPQGHPEIPQ